MSAVEFMEAEAHARHRRQRHGTAAPAFDLVLCPTVPAGPPLADAPTVDPVRALWTRVGAVDFYLQPDAPAGDHRAAGVRRGRDAEPVQIVAAQYRDDLVLRAARVLELTEPVGAPDPG